jgi:hypothetical protein
VGHATLTVTPAPQTISYGQADPSFSYTITGYQNGETATVLTSAPSCGVSGAHAAAGSYTIACSGGAAADYTFNDTATATLTVGQATLIVTPAPQSILYGQADPGFSYTITGYQNGETASALISAPSCGVSGADTDVGTYTISCSGGAAANYSFNDTATATLTVSQATLTVTPASRSVSYGQADPPFIYNITGYQNGATATVISSAPSCGVSGAHTAAGTYTISCSGGAAANYSFDESATAILTVTDNQTGGSPRLAPDVAVVGGAAASDGKGYWEVGADGGIFAFGDAKPYGSVVGKHLRGVIVGLASTPDGKGYWEVGADGGIFAFGDATYHGSPKRS